jgi:ribosomal protein S18 acetylase RimI-like enzyme
MARVARRPSKRANLNRLHQRGETVESLAIREATPDDVDALAWLHVRTFNETHTLFGRGGPSFDIRQWQYRQKFAARDPRWACFVVARADGALVGFAIGEPTDGDDYAGRLSKIYLLREYQRLGLGSRLVERVVHRLLDAGVGSMMLFSEPTNPSTAFYEALGGTRILTASGEFHGAYGWHDIRSLVARIATQ